MSGELIMRSFGCHVTHRCLSTLLLKGLVECMFSVCLLGEDLSLDGSKEEAS